MIVRLGLDVWGCVSDDEDGMAWDEGRLSDSWRVYFGSRPYDVSN